MKNRGFYITLNIDSNIKYVQEYSDYDFSKDFSMEIVEAINSCCNMSVVGIEATTFINENDSKNSKWSDITNQKLEEHIQKLLENHIKSSNVDLSDLKELCDWVEMCLEEDFDKNSLYGLITIKDNFSFVHMMLCDCCVDVFSIKSCYDIASVVECFEKYGIKLIIDYSPDYLKK